MIGDLRAYPVLPDVAFAPLVSVAAGLALGCGSPAGGTIDGGLVEMRDARYGHGAVMLADGSVLVVGGKANGRALASCELFDPTQGHWVLTGSLAEAREAHRTVALTDGRVLALGGSGDDGATASAEIYDATTGTWQAAAPMSRPRINPGAVRLDDGRVMVVGGLDAGPPPSAMSQVELYDPATDSWNDLPPLTFARGEPSVTALADGKVLVVGGVAYQEDIVPVGHVERFDPAGQQWTDLGDLFDPLRYRFESTRLADGRVLLAGGAASAAFAHVQLFEPAEGLMVQGAPMPEPRFEATTTLLGDGRVLLLAGGNSYDPQFVDPDFFADNPVATAVIYDPDADAWSSAPSLEAARAQHTATLLPDGRILVAGGVEYDFDASGGTIALSSSELYTP